MDEDRLSVNKEWLPEGLILSFKGQLTSSSEALFQEILSQDPWPKVTLCDFSDVDYINSSGIAMLIRLLRQSMTKGGSLRARGLSPHYQKIFRMVGLSDYIEIVD